MDPFYADDLTTVYRGDALDILDDLDRGTFDAVITDPPYVIGAVSAGTLNSKAGGWADMMNSALWFTTWYRKCWRLLRPSGCLWTFCNWRSVPVVMRASIDADVPVTSLAVWDKEWIGPGGPQGLRPSYEMIALQAGPRFAIPDRGVPDVIRWKVGSHKPTGHPAEKPVGLVERLIDITALGPDALILDPFGGSGTTAVAARNRGIRCVTVEDDARWCELIADRLRSAPMFTPAPVAPIITADPLWHPPTATPPHPTLLDEPAPAP